VSDGAWIRRHARWTIRSCSQPALISETTRKAPRERLELSTERAPWKKASTLSNGSSLCPCGHAGCGCRRPFSANASCTDRVRPLAALKHLARNGRSGRRQGPESKVAVKPAIGRSKGSALTETRENHNGIGPSARTSWSCLDRRQRVKRPLGPKSNGHSALSTDVALPGRVGRSG
jgi:hypothetical protein